MLGALFCCWIFAHHTSIVIFIVDGLVFIGECKDVDIVAWGSGSQEDEANRSVNNFGRANNNLFSFLNVHNDINASHTNADDANGQEGNANVDIAGKNVNLICGFGITLWDMQGLWEKLQEDTKDEEMGDFSHTKPCIEKGESADGLKGDLLHYQSDRTNSP